MAFSKDRSARNMFARYDQNPCKKILRLQITPAKNQEKPRKQLLALYSTWFNLYQEQTYTQTHTTSSGFNDFF